MQYRPLRLLAAVTALMIVGGCQHPLGDEYATRTEVELVIHNDSDEPIYFVRGKPGPSDIVTGIVNGLVPGESGTTGLGGQRLDSVPGGCLNDQQVSIFRNLSDTPISANNISDRMDDIEVLEHIPNGTCYDEDTIEYHWPPSDK